MSSIVTVENLKMVVAGAGGRVLESAPSILREVLDLSGAERPTVLTIPTAEPTPESHYEFVEKSRRKFNALGASVINLHDFSKLPSEEEAIDKIGTADAIWVAGGDTLRMIEVWKRNGINTHLRKMAERGTVLSGGSAGMLAWMKQGHSDSLSYHVANGEKWDYKFVEGLGYIAATGCPHYDAQTGDAELRETHFNNKFSGDVTLPSVGIGIDNMAALALNNGLFKVISAPDAEYPRASVHIITKSPSGLQVDQLTPTGDYQVFGL